MSDEAGQDGPYRFDILSLFPGLFAGFLQESLLGKALDAGKLAIALHNWREFATDKHGTVDDAPFGGGAGMVLKPEPLAASLAQVKAAAPQSRVVLLSPAGAPFTQEAARRWADGTGLVLMCGRYEGFDARIEGRADEIVSLGDYVLNGGEVAAMAIVEAVARLRPGVIGNAASLGVESHGQSGLLEAPHYTRPRTFEGEEVPAVLLSGNHAEIEKWRLAESLARTAERRPELLPSSEKPSSKSLLDAESRMGIFAALVHHPVLNRKGEVVTTALTNVDIHDIGRSARTYGLQHLFVVTPVTLQQRMVGEILGHWTAGEGATFNPRRAEALRRVTACESLDAACVAVEERSGKRPWVVVTSAREESPSLSFAELRARLPSLDRPVLIVFGTGWGLAEEAMNLADWRLPAITCDESLGEHDGYNHLSVRAAAAIVLDRLLGNG